MDISKIRIWNTNELANDFRKNAVSSSYCVFYIIGWFSFEAFDQWIGTGNDHPKNDLNSILFSLAVKILGIFWCYQANKKVDDQRFVDRFFAFSFANAIRVHIFVWVYLIFFLGFPLYGIKHFLNFSVADSLPSSPLVNAVTDLPIYLYFFYRVRSGIIKIGHPDSYLLGEPVTNSSE